MESIKKEFVTYQQALKLKELGFDEECFSYYDLRNKPNFFGSDNLLDTHCVQVNRPTYSQAFRWFRKEYDLTASVTPCSDGEYVFTIYDLGECDLEVFVEDIILLESEDTYDEYEEAESACLDKLIEIVESKEK